MAPHRIAHHTTPHHSVCVCVCVLVRERGTSSKYLVVVGWDFKTVVPTEQKKKTSFPPSHLHHVCVCVVEREKERDKMELNCLRWGNKKFCSHRGENKNAATVKQTPSVFR